MDVFVAQALVAMVRVVACTVGMAFNHKGVNH